MSVLFNRHVSVSFGKPGSQGKAYQGLRIAFEITKDDSPTPNFGKVTIYGLSRDSASELAVNTDQIIQLVAGYEGSEGLIFLGDITKSTTSNEGTERKTLIESGDGQKATSTARISKSYGKGTSPADVIGDLAGNLADKLGLNKSKVKSKVKSITKPLLPSVNPYPRGLSLNGSTAQNLSKVCKANKLDWTIQDGELMVYQPEKAQGEAFLLSPESGLIGSPILSDKKRLELKCLLNPELRPRKIVRVKSQEFEGFYVIRRVKHYGDSGYDSPFYSELELTAIKGV